MCKKGERFPDGIKVREETSNQRKTETESMRENIAGTENSAQTQSAEILVDYELTDDRNCIVGFSVNPRDCVNLYH